MTDLLWTIFSNYYSFFYSPISSAIYSIPPNSSFGAMGLAQISAAIEALNGARAACHPALLVINRNVNDDSDVEEIESTRDFEKSIDLSGGKRKDIPLPKYVIDSSSTDGKQPTKISGEIVFKGVSFRYPTRLEKHVFNGFNLTCEAGKTVALVGPRYVYKNITSLVSILHITFMA